MSGTLSPGALGPWMGCCRSKVWLPIGTELHVACVSWRGAGKEQGRPQEWKLPQSLGPRYGIRRNGGEVRGRGGVYCSHMKSPSVPPLAC